MNELRDAIVVGAYRCHREHRLQPRGPDSTRRVTAGERRSVALDTFYLRLDYAGWIEHTPTHAERMAMSRELVRLEEAGLLVRLRAHERDRTTHVHLTPLGEAEAMRLTIDSLDVLPIEAPWEKENPVPAP